MSPPSPPPRRFIVMGSVGFCGSTFSVSQALSRACQGGLGDDKHLPSDGAHVKRLGGAGGVGRGGEGYVLD